MLEGASPRTMGVHDSQRATSVQPIENCMKDTLCSSWGQGPVFVRSSLLPRIGSMQNLPLVRVWMLPSVGERVGTTDRQLSIADTQRLQPDAEEEVSSLRNTG